jgi:hypothetical protein
MLKEKPQRQRAFLVDMLRIPNYARPIRTASIPLDEGGRKSHPCTMRSTMRKQTYWQMLLAAFFLLAGSAAQAASWEQVGAVGFSAGVVQYISLAIDSGGRPYIAYRDYANGYKASVMRYNSAAGTWEQVGAAGFSAGQAIDVSLAIDSGGTPYIAYSDEAKTAPRRA